MLAFFRSISIRGVVTILICGSLAFSQTPEPSDRAANNPAANNKERASRLADLVSLSPGAITQLLQREPGLLLEVKKALVRKAYEEGRLLNPEDLTDDALFQQLHDDPAVRSLATREIEARMYVRAKPNADELHQDPDWAIVEKGSFQARGAAEQPASASQEGQYWATHEQIPLTHEKTEGASPEDEEVPVESPKPRVAPRPLGDFRTQPSLTANGGADWFLPPETAGTSAATQPGMSGVVNASLTQPLDPVALNAGVPRAGVPYSTASAVPQSLSLPANSNYLAPENSYAPRVSIPSAAAPPAKLEREPDPNRPVIRRQPNPYQDVPALYDLYKQFSKRSPVLQRFGLDVFQNGSGTADQLPMDVPVGPDYNLTDIQAALGLHQLRRLPEFHARRKTIAQRYTRAFREFDELEIPTERAWAGHAWHLYVLRLNLDRLNISRDAFIDELRARNIGASVHFIPVHLFTYYRERYRFSAGDFPVASREFERMLSLPCSPHLTADDLDDVIEAVQSIVEQHSVSRFAALATRA
jgi:DegT/DnrJ/EryC1/StrS aminotransferase family